MNNLPSSIAQVLVHRARVEGASVAYRVLSSNGSENACITYAELEARAAHLADGLSQSMRRGDRALLMFASVDHFIYSFFACLKLGIIAVPLKPMQNRESLDRLQKICSDCAPSVLLMDSDVRKNLAEVLENDPVLGSLIILDTNEFLRRSDSSQSATHNGIHDAPQATDAAFIQYTSGSTGNPKGVTVSNGNIIANSEMIRRSFGYAPATVMVSWLPLFHDMGLIGGILQPMYTGFTCVLMNSVHFIQRPMSWLSAISRYRATTTGAPNFAYDLCIAGFRESALAGVGLSSLTLMFNGAEPVKRATLEKFSALYERFGFDKKAFTPCYGMAEATLLIGCKPVGELYRHVHVCAAELEYHQRVMLLHPENGKEGLPLVSNGKPAPGMDVVILSTEGPAQLLLSQQMGQIAIKGASVTAGYWGAHSFNSEKFVYVESAPSPGVYFLTGDFGFFLDGELYVVGRIDDMMIINGRNIYPDGIEHAVEQSSNLIVKNGCVCFQFDKSVALLVELARRDVDEADLKSMTDSIRSLVFNDFNVSLKELHFVRKRSLPKTSSGKKMRKYCRNRFLVNADTFLDSIRVEAVENA